MTIRIGYLVGSLSSTSINRQLGGVLLVALAPAVSCGSPTSPSGHPSPVQPRSPPSGPAAGGGRGFKEAVASCDGLLIVSPEYNRSISWSIEERDRLGVAAARQQLLRPRKPTGIIGASTGHIGTAVMTQSSMRSVLSFLDAPQLNSPEAYIQYSPEVFQDDGEVTDDSTREFLTAYMAEFRTYIGMVLTVLPRR